MLPLAPHLGPWRPAGAVGRSRIVRKQAAGRAATGHPGLPLVQPRAEPGLPDIPEYHWPKRSAKPTATVHPGLPLARPRRGATLGDHPPPHRRGGPWGGANGLWRAEPAGQTHKEHNARQHTTTASVVPRGGLQAAVPAAAPPRLPPPKILHAIPVHPRARPEGPPMSAPSLSGDSGVLPGGCQLICRSYDAFSGMPGRP